MAIGDGDIASGIFFGDFGRTIVFGGATALGIFDAPGKDAMFGKTDLADIEYCLTLPSGAFVPMPKSKDRLSVADVAYQVKSATPLDDGALVEYKLRAL